MLGSDVKIIDNDADLNAPLSTGLLQVSIDDLFGIILSCSVNLVTFIRIVCLKAQFQFE